MKLQEMTWQEIRDKAKKGATAVLPLGSLEQHGPHLPVVTDTGLVDAVVESTAEAIEKEVPLVVAPTLWLGASNHHQGFFALSLDEGTYIDVLVQTIRSFALAGFERLFVLNGHGGNSSPLRIAMSKIRREDLAMLVGCAEYWSIAAPALRELRQSSRGGAAHAGEIETSLMLHLRPDDVRVDKIGSTVPKLPDHFAVDLIDSGPVSLSSSWESLSETGQVGDGEIASGERGGRFFEAVCTAFAACLRSFHTLTATA